MEHLAPLRSPCCFLYSGPYCCQSVTLEMWVKLFTDFNTMKYLVDITCFSIYAVSSIDRDHESFVKSTTRFIQTFT